MTILEIINYNDPNTSLLINLLYQQMIDINAKKNRSDIDNAIKNALKPESRAQFFLLKENDNPIGVSFVNVGSSIESGGDYLWINEIQIAPSFRGKGYGSKLLSFIKEWADRKEMKAILCVTAMKNEASQGMFRSAGFSIDDVKWVEKL